MLEKIGLALEHPHSFDAAELLWNSSITANSNTGKRVLEQICEQKDRHTNAFDAAVLLEFIHSKSLIHRNINPEDIVVGIGEKKVNNNKFVCLLDEMFNVMSFCWIRISSISLILVGPHAFKMNKANTFLLKRYRT